jgi:4-hydroxy-3-polyprenylbenzoate decarboxylase
MPNKIVVAITGASGAIYANVLLQQLLLYKAQYHQVAVVMSNNAKQVWQCELQNEAYNNLPFTFYDTHNFDAPFASGSANFDTMIIVPCSMGTMARIAAGVSDSLITRAADVMLKERKKLIIVTRETPLSLIHINNMQQITLAGGIILPASPSFYSLPKTLDDVAATVTNRVLAIAGFKTNGFEWGK